MCKISIPILIKYVQNSDSPVGNHLFFVQLLCLTKKFVLSMETPKLHKSIILKCLCLRGKSKTPRLQKTEKDVGRKKKRYYEKCSHMKAKC